MYTILKKNNFNFSQHTLNISLTPPLSKSENQLLRKIFFVYRKEREKYLFLNENEFEKEKTLKKLEKLSRVSINYEYYLNTDPENNYLKGSVNLLSYFYEQKKICVKLSEEVAASFSRNSFWSRINLATLVTLKSEQSLRFFLYLQQKEANKNEIFFEIEELKKLLNIPLDSYPRFYDFEKYVLKPTFEDILLLGDEITIEYKKIKRGTEKSHRVTGVKILFLNNYFDTLHSNSNLLISNFSSKIKDFKSIYELFFEYLKIISYEQIYLMCTSILDNENFDLIIRKKLESFINVD